MGAVLNRNRAGVIMRKIRVLFLIHTLGAGGAERALVNLVNNMDSSKFDITVETMFEDGINKGLLKNNINYISKKAPYPKGISIILKFFPSKLLYKFFIGKEKYDILIAYMHGVPIKVLAPYRNTKKIAWIHNGNPESSTMFRSWVFKRNSFSAYKSFNKLVGVCESVSNAFSQYTGINNLKTIYNTLDVERIKNQALLQTQTDFDKSYVNIVSTGRLAKEKGYSRLLEVCKRLKEENYRFRLYLVGRGSEENKLKSLSKSYDLENTVFLLGFQENPYAYVNACDVFVCSSFTEGLSTATIEALILGKAIVSTDVSGAREIIGDSEYGLVVENSTEGIYEGLKVLLDNPEKIDFFKAKALERAPFFDTKNTVTAVESLIEEVINE